MTTRDAYVALLEKRASDQMHESIPENNSAKATVDEYSSNQEDNRQYLHSIFTQAGPSQTQQTAEAKKLFPGFEGTKISGNPLMKLASREYFFAAVSQGERMKTASPLHLEVAFHAFCNELEKISGVRPRIPGAGLSGGGRTAMMNAGARSAGPSTVMRPSQPLPAGSGTSVHDGGGGFFSRLFSKNATATARGIG